MRKEEAFALHMCDLFNDAINNHTGSLRLIIEGLSPDVKDDIGRNLKDSLQRQVDDLQKKLERAIRDTKEFVGGENNYRLLRNEDFFQGCKPTAEGWK